MDRMLAGRQFTVCNDHANLQWLATCSESNSKAARWSAYLAPHDFTLTWRPGTKMVGPDALSRLPMTDPQDDPLEDDQATKKIAVEKAVQHHQEPPVINVNTVSASQWRDSVRASQLQWDLYQPLKQAIQQRLSSEETQTEATATGAVTVTTTPKLAEQYKRAAKHMHLEEDGTITIKDRYMTGPRKRLVTPPSDQHKEQLWQDYHVGHGHRGATSTWADLEQHVWWPSLRQWIHTRQQACEACQRTDRTTPGHAEHRGSSIPEAPGIKWAVDLVGPFPHNHEDFAYVLTVLDTYHGFVRYKPLKTKAMWGVANAITTTMLETGHFPCELLSDNGPEFVNEMIAGINEDLQIRHGTTTAYRPRASEPIANYAKSCQHTAGQNKTVGRTNCRPPHGSTTRQ